MKINLRRKRAIKILSEKGGSVGSAMIEAGYTKITAKNPSRLTNSPEFKSALERYKSLRSGVLLEMESRNLTKEKLRDLSDLMKKLDDAVNTLEGRGGNTFNIAIVDAEKYRRIIEREAGYLSTRSEKPIE